MQVPCVSRQEKMIGDRAGRVPAKQAGRGESPRQCLDSPGGRHHHWGGLLASGPESLTILGPRAGVVRGPDRGPRSPVTSPADRGRPPTRETGEFLAGMRRAPGARTLGPSFTESFSTLLRSPPPLRDMGRGHAGGPRCDRRTRRREALAGGASSGDARGRPRSWSEPRRRANHGVGRSGAGGFGAGSGAVPGDHRGGLPGDRRRAVPDQADRRRGGRRLGRHLRRGARRRSRPSSAPAGRVRRVGRGPHDRPGQRPLDGPVHGRRGRGGTSTRSRPGSTASPPGTGSCPRRPRPARTSPASCWKGPSSSARRPIAPRAPTPTGSASGPSSWPRPASQAGARPGGARPASWSSGMARYPDRSRGSAPTTRSLGIIVERERARFGAWYEMFPRSARVRAGPARHASATSRRGCPTSPAWASTCSTCRRSTRSAGPSARGRTTP